ncbi:MAG: TetR/AcrR family transcriptional regulator [Solirubrobacteraceae bacterium]
MPDRDTVPRGRHAPPLEVRQELQRQRLAEAAASVFARTGYADATAEAIAREAGMSKATFYEHFANKEDCILALFDRAMALLIGAMQGVRDSQSDVAPMERYKHSITALLGVMDQYPDYAQTLLIEIIGAGRPAMERRDSVFAAIAGYIDARNAEDAEAGLAPRLASPDDALAVVGATVELASRQIRTGVPDNIADLAPVIERLIRGVLIAAESAPAAV